MKVSQTKLKADILYNYYNIQRCLSDIEFYEKNVKILEKQLSKTKKEVKNEHRLQVGK